MTIAILHFHLRRGGVTSVMFRQASCLAMNSANPQVVFLSGTPSEAPSPVPLFVVPELDYDSFTLVDPADREAGAFALARSLEETLIQAFPGGCDLLHVHNPNLCKNTRLAGALHLLQKRGQALLIQVHDLAEDFRPQVYESFWPYLENCDYATINHRDRNNLMAAGLEPEHIRFLPNPVTEVADFEPRGPWRAESARGRSTVLYPVRAIRRKNLGEALLLSRFLPPGTELAVTLPPTSPGDLARYQEWKAVAQRLGLPVRFEAGVSRPLAELYRMSFRVITTSVKEGFGYSYLEPLIRGLPVVGRRLPAVVDDFTAAGLSFPGLYSALRIPRSRVPEAELRAMVETCLTSLRGAFAPVFEKGGLHQWESIRTVLAARFEGEFLDFGALDESLQTHVLTGLEMDPAFTAQLVRENPFLESLFDEAPSATEAFHQREIVRRVYSEEEYGKLLFRAYEVAASRAARGRIDKAVLASRYLLPSAFFGVAL